MLELVQNIADLLQKYELSHDQFRQTLQCMLQEEESKDKNRFLAELADNKSALIEDIMSIAQQLRQEGHKQGRQEGEVAKARATALSMLAESEPLVKIARYTGLTEEEIKHLRPDTAPTSTIGV